MTDVIDQLYSPHQILIPPNLPSILKKYAKAAIRTQPRDLLLWSYHYFKAIVNGLPPPVKERIEYPLPNTVTGLTPGFLKLIINQIGNVKTVSKEAIEDKWESICLEKDKIEILFKIGNFTQEVKWLNFVAIAAGTIEQNLTDTMSLLCELLTEEPEGGSSMVSIETFLDLYKYLAELNCGPVNPYAVIPEPSEEVQPQVVQKDIQFSDTRTDRSEETWDTLIREMGKEDSEDTIATDDLREVDSKAGLVVWPDMIPEELKVNTLGLTPKPSDEFINSDTGLQVWDEEQFQTKVAKKAEIPQTLDGEKRGTPRSIPKNVYDASGHHEKVQEVSNEINSGQGQEINTEHDISHPEFPSHTDESLKANLQPSVEELNINSLENKKNDINVEFIMEPDPSMILIPTPIASKESICSSQRSIKNVTESENEPSVGQKLINTASLKDLKVGLTKVKREGTPPEWASGDFFWISLPGIGPIVPQNIIDEVEVFLRQCATKQCGMVMPRNLRHFLCPSLDGLTEDVYIVNEQPECIECCPESVGDDNYEVMRLPKVELDHFVF